MHMLLWRMMLRTTIMLPMDLKRRAQTLAQRMGISLGELIRESLQATLRGDAGEVREDTLFGDGAIYDGPISREFSDKHDHFLYDLEEDQRRQ